MSFIRERVSADGLTFDDVLLLPSYSEILPSEVLLKSMFTRLIEINTPIVSAAMDTVTEFNMAISMAREGGIGVIHKNMSIMNQANQVRAVKRAENGMILNPVTVNPTQTVADVLQLMEYHKIGGIPVINKDHILVGIVTNRDLRFEINMHKLVGEVMTSENLITTNQSSNLEQAAEILQKHKIEKLPVVDKDMRLIGLVTYKDITKAKDKPLASKDSKGRLRCAASVGTDSSTMERIEALVKAEVDAIVIDTAHAHSLKVLQTLRTAKINFPDVEYVVGNVATAEAASDLALSGADSIKVGIGPGSICTTRIVTGVGVPQLSAIYNVARSLRKSGIPVIADGGIRYSGDIVKALAAGADCIMAGSIIAGVEESPGETLLYQGRKFKTYRGMGSVEAMQQGSKDRYFQSHEVDEKKLVPEGIVGRIPYKGTLNEVIYQMIGGVKSGMGYCGTRTIKDLHSAKFTRITASGIRENHPHDVSITREAPNYSVQQ